MYFEGRDSDVLDEVHELICDGADVNAENRFHDTPLHFAVRHCNNKIEVIKELLEKGADINAKDWHGDTPLHSVFNFRDSNVGDVVRWRKQMRYNIVLHRFRNTLLHNAVHNRVVDPEVVKLLLRHGADVNAKNWGSNTPLHCAVKFRNNGLEEIRLLIMYGASINAQNLIGDTPLHKAVLEQGNKVDAIRELWWFGADFTIKNSTDETPLLLFMRECVVKQCEGTSLCDLDCAKYLIKCTLIQMSKKVDLKTTSIDPSLKELLKMFDKYLLLYYQECVSEVLYMKTDEISENLTLYDLVSDCVPFALGRFNREETKIITDHIFRQLANNVYPLFGVGFITNILSRSDLNNKLSELQVCSTFNVADSEKVIRLYSCSTLNIAKYLSDKDLINVILAIYGVKESNKSKIVRMSSCPTEINNDLKRTRNSFSGCCTKHARLESPSATGFDYSFESKASTLQRY